jgi:hypothetical protein
MALSKHIPRIILAACLAAGITGLPLSRAGSADNDAAMAAGAVKAFYDAYVKAHNESLNSGFDYRKQPQVDPALVKKITALFKEAEKSEPYVLGYDPILMAQDIPRGMEYGKPAVAGDKAAMLAYTLWDGGFKSSICVSLVKTENVWRISDVNHMDDEKLIPECRALSPGEKAKQ